MFRVGVRVGIWRWGEGSSVDDFSIDIATRWEWFHDLGHERSVSGPLSDSWCMLIGRFGGRVTGDASTNFYGSGTSKAAWRRRL